MIYDVIDAIEKNLRSQSAMVCKQAVCQQKKSKCLTHNPGVI